MDKEQYNLGEHVILKNGKVGKIEEFFQESGRQMFRYNEYYTPDRTTIGKQEYHSNFELFRTDEIEKSAVENISSKCEVFLNFDMYIKKLLLLKEKKIPINAQLKIFFVRQKYSVEDDHLAPDLANSCYCDMPFNPDKNFIVCKRCKEYLHVDCFLLGESKKCFNQVCDNNIEIQLQTAQTISIKEEKKNALFIGNKRDREDLIENRKDQVQNNPLETNQNNPMKKQKAGDEDKSNEQYPNLSENSRKYLQGLISKNEKKGIASNSHVSNEEKIRISIREKIFNSLV